MARSKGHDPNFRMDSEAALAAVVTVGDGRGFIVGRRGRFVVTAAHCLPNLPPAGCIGDIGEQTYWHLLAPLNSPPSIAAECLFADPVADIAVLGPPDTQELFEEAEDFINLVDGAPALGIAAAKDGEAWMLSREGVWAPCVLRIPAMAHWSAAFHVESFEPGIRPGMSGSPVVSPIGDAVGVICASIGEAPSDLSKVQIGPYCPNLMTALPARLLDLM